MHKEILAVVIFLLLCAFLYFVLIKSKEYVRVSGTGRTTATPDQAQVDIGLRTSDVPEEQLNDTRQNSATVFQRIIDDIKQRAPQAKIETQGFNVSENYAVIANNNGNQTPPKTFTISNRISVTIKDVSGLSLIPQLIDSAVALGANDIGNVSYSLTDKAKQKALQKAQVDSMRDAFEKAKILAESGGKSLGSVVSIEETGQAEVFPMFARASFANDSVASTPTPIPAPETLPVTSNVTVQYSLD